MSHFKTLSDDEVRELVRANTTYAEISRVVGVKICGASKAILATRILELNLDTSHFVKRKADKLSKTTDADFAAHVRSARSCLEVARLCDYDVRRAHRRPPRQRLRAQQRRDAVAGQTTTAGRPAMTVPVQRVQQHALRAP
jgi:hypothetical protein